MILPLFDDWCVRSFTGEDAEAIVKYANNRHVWINLRDSFPSPYTIHDAKKWLRNVKKHAPEMSWALANSTEVIGGIGIHLLPDVYRQSAEIGYWLGEPFWRKGIATAAVKGVVDFSFENFGLLRLHAGVFEWNPASARVLEKAGFRFEARLRKAVVKDGKNIDQMMYTILLEEWKARKQK